MGANGFSDGSRTTGQLSASTKAMVAIAAAAARMNPFLENNSKNKPKMVAPKPRYTTDSNILVTGARPETMVRIAKPTRTAAKAAVKTVMAAIYMSRFLVIIPNKEMTKAAAQQIQAIRNGAMRL